MKIGRRALFGFGLLAALGVTAPLQAQSWPDKPVRIIVPFPPGGGFDGVARPFAERMGAVLGQTVLIDNRAGAAGNIGAQAAARAVPDGYTLLFANDFLATNPPMYKAPGFDPLKDFVPVSAVATVSQGIAVATSSPAKDLKDLVALSKTRPLNVGTPGIGSVPHLLTELINLEGGMRLANVPYKGSAPAVTDAIGGQVDMVLTTLPSLTPHIRAGKLRGIVVMGSKRDPSLPELPTFSEAGGSVTGGDIWYALFAPAGTPEPVLKRLREAVREVLAQNDLVERLRGVGYELGGSTPEALGQRVRSDMERWRRVIVGAKIPME
jgi:tripartite-type tricarboxylate transporter receptor subunit TctC